MRHYAYLVVIIALIFVLVGLGGAVGKSPLGWLQALTGHPTASDTTDTNGQPRCAVELSC